MLEYQAEFMDRLNGIEVDAHWFRRVFHTFAASFLLYYLLPDELWINLLKIYIPIFMVAGISIIEYRRITGEIKHERFFGLRSYEQHRPASYLFFGIALLFLFLFFPQQIAIPCILCAAFTDPVIGELRFHLDKKKAYLIGFLLSMMFFLLTWFRAEWWIVLLVSLLGASGAILGEAKKLRLLDDDFMIQMLPAIILFILWQGLLLFSIDILPGRLILPL